MLLVCVLLPIYLLTALGRAVWWTLTDDDGPSVRW